MGWVLISSLFHTTTVTNYFPVFCYASVTPKSTKAAGHGSGMNVPRFLWHVVALLRERLMLLCVVHTDISYLSGPAKWGVGDNCKLIILLCSQIDEDKRRDTTQRLRQGKYDKKVTWLQCPCFLPWLRGLFLRGGHSSPETIPPLPTLQNGLILWKE